MMSMRKDERIALDLLCLHGMLVVVPVPVLVVMVVVLSSSGVEGKRVPQRLALPRRLLLGAGIDPLAELEVLVSALVRSLDDEERRRAEQQELQQDQDLQRGNVVQLRALLHELL